MNRADYIPLVKESIREHMPTKMLAYYGRLGLLETITKAYTNPRTDDITITFSNGTKHHWTYGDKGLVLKPR